MEIIKPDPQLIENTKTALRILEYCAKAAAVLLNHTSFPALLVPEDDGEKVKALDPGEIVEVPPKEKGGDILSRPLRPGETVEIPTPGSRACMDQADKDHCIKPAGHEGAHASTRRVWI